MLGNNNSKSSNHWLNHLKLKLIEIFDVGSAFKVKFGNKWILDRYCKVPIYLYSIFDDHINHDKVGPFSPK